jgi:thiamine biosynthesis lipoprotein
MDVVDEFAASDRAMSRFRDDSEVTELNRAIVAGRAASVGRRLRAAVAVADRAHRVTGGRFDPRVLRTLDRWGYRGASIGADRLAAHESVAESRVVACADRTGIRVADPVDLGGIGKGLALRWAATRLDRLPIARFLLDAGGDIVARGSAPDGGPWRVGIEDPGRAEDDGGSPVAVLSLHDGAVATSSIRRLRWSDGQRVLHHLVDPSTGSPANGGLLAVTVAGTDPAWAEVWSKALFVAGRGRVRQLADDRGIAALLVDTDGVIGLSRAMRPHVLWRVARA